MSGEHAGSNPHAGASHRGVVSGASKVAGNGVAPDSPQGPGGVVCSPRHARRARCRARRFLPRRAEPVPASVSGSRRETRGAWWASTTTTAPCGSTRERAQRSRGTRPRSAGAGAGPRSARRKGSGLGGVSAFGWTRHDTVPGLVNSGTAEVAEVRNGRVSFLLDDGGKLELWAVATRRSAISTTPGPRPRVRFATWRRAPCRRAWAGRRPTPDPPIGCEGRVGCAMPCVASHVVS